MPRTLALTGRVSATSSSGSDVKTKTVCLSSQIADDAMFDLRVFLDGFKSANMNPDFYYITAYEYEPDDFKEQPNG